MQTLSVVVMAPGTVIPSQQLSTVQHLEGGLIKTIFIAEGQTVTAGQALMALDPTALEADIRDLQYRLQTFIIKRDRLNVEAGDVLYLEGHAPQFNLKTSEPTTEQSVGIIRRQRALFEARKEKLDAQLSIQAQLIEQYQYQKIEMESRITKNISVQALLAEKVSISESLLGASLSNRMNHIDLLQNLQSIQGLIEEGKSSLGRYAALVAEAEARKEMIQAVFELGVHQSLQALQGEQYSVKQALHKALERLQHLVIRAPIAGRVKSLHSSTLGGVLAPGDFVADIVPQNSELLVTAKLVPSDIGYIHTGQEVQLRLASADGLRFTASKGVVVQISPDTLPEAQGQSHYQIRIKTQQPYFDSLDGSRFHWEPGLLVQCHILIGQRSVARYILQPFFGPLAFAMKER